MAEKIEGSWFKCEYPGCPFETDKGFLHLGQRYCTACFKTVKEQLNKEVKGGKV